MTTTAEAALEQLTNDHSNNSNSLGLLQDRMQDAHVNTDDHNKTDENDDDEGIDTNLDEDNDEEEDEEDDDTAKVTLIAKFGKERICLEHLPEYTTIGQVKQLLRSKTNVLPKRQKLVGLQAAQTNQNGTKGVFDELPLSELKSKGSTTIVKQPASKSKNATTITTHQFILMGTPEKDIFVDPSERGPDALPDVIDDFELDFNAGSDEWLQHVANEENLRQFTEQTMVHLMNPPRPGKPLLVLDLDHTLLDFSSRQILTAGAAGSPDLASIPGVAAGPPRASSDHVVAAMKRPFMNEFLATCYRYYDLVVWSQTSWRWLETKLIELGMLTHPGYKFVFVLDKTSMFTVVSTKRNDRSMSITHHVKPLQIIWSKFPEYWGPHNTVHVDDLSRNFALNLGSGLKIKPYHRKKSSARKDMELLLLSRYLTILATAPGVRFEDVDFSKWPDVVAGKRPLLTDSSMVDGSTTNKSNNNGNSKKS
jgi:ubiquitin-like domain-containing CTD phosphatase 1